MWSTRSRSRKATFAQLRRLVFSEPSSRSSRAGSIAALLAAGYHVNQHFVIPLIPSGLHCGRDWARRSGLDVRESSRSSRAGSIAAGS